MKNAVNWFEIPVNDLERAVRFYEAVFRIELKRERSEDLELAIFPSDQAGVGGALSLSRHRAPSPNGSLVYLNATGVLDEVLARIEGASGHVLLPKTNIGDPGFIALFSDSEGNVVGLHAPH
ncbi:VOC family protein [Pendulispora brunnea]|uniref:VOC family protein n=1 Tax=Pendulispora brunnea TaxID=2905690 RepID=A0ABZ2K8X9_9BACT